jgi:HK97 family phage major capsid protein
MPNIAELRRKFGDLTDKLNKPEVIADARAFEETETEITNIEGEIARAERAQARAASLARPVGDQIPADPAAVERAAAGLHSAPTVSSMARELRAHARREGEKADFSDALSIARKNLGFMPSAQNHFRTFGEQLHAISDYYLSKGTRSDSRLVRAPTGAGEVDPTGGGFLVQVDFAASIFMLSHDMGDIIQRVNKIPISATSNGLKIPGVDETSRATGSRWGGVSSKWAAEGVAGDESKPKFRLIEFDLKKLISKMTITDELLADSTALTAIAAQAFSEEITFMTEDAIWEGSGAGQPLGVINSPALIQVAKQNGQSTGTIVKENIDNMWARMWARSRKNALWHINQDAEPQLNQMNQAVGTGGQLVYLPPGGVANAPNASLYGRPMIATEYNAALGSPGDIALVDWSQYTIVDKGGVQMATSIHVAFDTDEMRFRITYRVDGKPMWTKPMTPFKGNLTKSPFIALAQR